ncbi:hypothetical protein [Rhodobacter ferrooxidans]|uniref:DUF302 domain-containing protein n=1 Tax=Rhodobacter ferrooxidans TaxID=371731 RepID=C8S1I0_9RHOB|nr:hypothetical protein [Rhodobacter sp. SW2]EEW25153.1 conserved hypothetical protein [Rhodobacter sp. SW2]
MFKTLLSSAALILALTPASFAAPLMVQDIDVQIDMMALSNAEAATRFATMEGDLENALTARLIDRIAEKGVHIIVDVSEVELSNSYTEKMSLADTRLVANVKITDDTDNSNFNAYELSVDINAAKVFFPEGTDVMTLPATSEVYYTSLIAAFADAVVSKLDE